MISISRKMQRRIYMFYFFVLLFALSWRLVSAGSSFCRVENFKIEEHASETEIVVSLNSENRPAAQFLSDSRCLILDFNNTLVAGHLAEKAFAGRDIRLGYVTRSLQKNDSARIRLYIRSGCLASLRYNGTEVIVRVAGKTSLSAPATVEAGLLLSPAEEKYAPAVISLHDAPLLPVINELAALAGIQVELYGDLPDHFSTETQADNPLDALKSIAQSCGLDMARRGQVWHIAVRDTAEPRVYAYSGELLQ